MRISDWSSDVRSSDLLCRDGGREPDQPAPRRADTRPDRRQVRHAAGGQPEELAGDSHPRAHLRRGGEPRPPLADRKSVVEGKSVTGRVGRDGDVRLKKKKLLDTSICSIIKNKK